MFKKTIKNRKGTALLIALLVMGVFMAISLALSSLILRETRITKSFIDSGQAYYSAESGIELALYALNTRLPGWQPDGEGYEDGFQSFTVDEDQNAVGEFSLENRCRAYPCFDEEEFDLRKIRELAVGDSGYAKYFYDVLDLNESLTIPLFVYDGNDVKDVEDFVVEFFSPLNPREHLEFRDKGKIHDWDVLRWKLVGIRKGDAVGGGKDQTETISDFNAVTMVDIRDEAERIRTNAIWPSWFGTGECDQFKDRYFDDIDCKPYVYKGQKINTSEFDQQLAKIDTQVCPQHMAKEFYLYDYFGGERAIKEIMNCYPIKTFLREHTLNYLILTNMVNPSAFSGDALLDKEKLSRLFFRIELDNAVVDGGENAGDGAQEAGALVAETVRPVANITANGYSGKSKQSINVKITRGSFMPVFNFSLYSTFMDESKHDSRGNPHDFNYWYTERGAEPRL